jgi:zinc protease
VSPQRKGLFVAALILCVWIGAPARALARRARADEGRPPAIRAASSAAEKNSAVRPRILPDYTRVVLKNGLVLLVMEQHELPLVNFRLIVKTGSAADPKGKEGLASLTGDVMRFGTRTKTASEYSVAVVFLGGSIEPGGDADKTSVGAEFLSRDYQKGLSLLAEMVLTPAFSPEEIERARGQTLAAIVQDLDDPSAIAGKQFQKALYGEHPYAKPQEGTKESVAAITREDVQGFYGRNYAPNNSILAIVGDISKDRAIEAAKAAFGSWAKKPVPPTPSPEPPAVRGKRVVIVDKPDVTQSQIILGTIGIRRADKSYFPSQIEASILGGGFTSWLNQEIREKRGLSYGAGCGFEPRLMPGPFTVRTFTKNETVGETIDVALQTLAKFRSGGFTDDDLRNAQNYMAGQYPLTVETTNALAAQIAGLEFYGLGREFVDRQIESLRGVTLADLKTVAPKLPVDDYLLVVVTNAAAVRPQLEKFGKVEVVPFNGP